MAWVEQFFLTVGIGDCRDKITPVEVRIDATEAQVWLAAVPGVIRDATEVGVLIQAIEGLTEGTTFYEQVALRSTDDAAVFPADSTKIYGFDKVGVQFKAGLNNYNFTIPARNDANFNVAPNGIDIAITGGDATAEVTALVAAVNDTVLSKYGATVTVTGMKVVS